MKIIICFILLSIVSSVLSQDANACLQWPTCKECIAHNLCGWCAVPVVYQDGTLGPRCAGKPQDPAHPPPGWKPWTCPKDFQNQKCYGYKCDNTTFQCVSAGPSGGGVPLQTCIDNCFPPTYECNNVTLKCYQVTPGHGTDIHTCEAQCVKSTTTTTTSTSGSTGPGPQPPGYTCNPATMTCVETSSGGAPLQQCQANCQNVTPVFVIGDYRGLEVDHMYLKGEWQAKITEVEIVIVDPTGKIWAKGQVRQSANELWLVTSMGTRRGLYEIEQLPEVSVLTWAMGGYGQPAPSSFEAALTSGDTFVFAKCLSDTNCKWKMFQSANKIKLAKEKLSIEKKFSSFQAIDDPCSKYPDCHTCIAAPEWCGWCSVPIMYDINNTTVYGKNCAGLNTTVTPRINCTGTFSTVDCLPPTTSSTGTSTSGSSGSTGGTKKYYCDPVTSVCVQNDNGTLPIDVCSAQCTVVPFVPIVLQDRYFRGLEIDMEYAAGEWRAHFSKIDVTVVSPSGVVIQGNVTTTGEYLTIHVDKDNAYQTIWQLQPGPAVDNLSWAWGALNGVAPTSFNTGMNTPGQTEYWYVACHPGEPTTTCDFSH